MEKKDFGVYAIDYLFSLRRVQEINFLFPTEVDSEGDSSKSKKMRLKFPCATCFLIDSDNEVHCVINRNFWNV